MKKILSTVKKLPVKRFAELHSDWPKLLFGSQALVRGHVIRNAFNPIPQWKANELRGIA